MAQFFDTVKMKFSATRITPKPSLVTTSSPALLASGIVVLAIAPIVWLYVNRLDKRAVVIPPVV